MTKSEFKHVAFAFTFALLLGLCAATLYTTYETSVPLDQHQIQMQIERIEHRLQTLENIGVNITIIEGRPVWVVHEIHAETKEITK